MLRVLLQHHVQLRSCYNPSPITFQNKNSNLTCYTLLFLARWKLVRTFWQVSSEEIELRLDIEAVLVPRKSCVEEWCSKRGGHESRRGCSSNGRALALHARGTGIDTRRLHTRLLWFLFPYPIGMPVISDPVVNIVFHNRNTGYSSHGSILFSNG